jgi:hypothetical protein
VQAADPEEDADSNEVSVGLVCSQNVALGFGGCGLMAGVP